MAFGGKSVAADSLMSQAIDKSQYLCNRHVQRLRNGLARLDGGIYRPGSGQQAPSDRPAVNMTWYNGGRGPESPPHLEGANPGREGLMIIGEEGTLVGSSDSGAPRLYLQFRN